MGAILCPVQQESSPWVQLKSNSQPLYQHKRVNPLAQTENIAKINRPNETLHQTTPKTTYKYTYNSTINNYPTTQQTNNNLRFTTQFSDLAAHSQRSVNFQPYPSSSISPNKQILYAQSNFQPPINFKYQQTKPLSGPIRHAPANSTVNPISRAQIGQNQRPKQSSQLLNPINLSTGNSNVNFQPLPTYNISSNSSRISQQRISAFKLNVSQIDKNQYYKGNPWSLRQSAVSQQQRDQINRKRKQIQSQTDRLQKIQKRTQLACQAFSIHYQQFAEQQFKEVINQIEKTSTRKSEQQDILAYASASLANIYIINKKDTDTISIVARKAIAVYQLNPSNYVEETITLKNNLALAYENSKMFREAIKLYKEVLQLEDRFYSMGDERRLSTLNNLFCLYSEQKDSRQAQNIKNIILKNLGQVDKNSSIYQIFRNNLDHYSEKSTSL